MVSTLVPPHDLQLVIDFVNTLDLESGEDAIADVGGLRDWLRERHLLGADASEPGARDVAEAIQLREALRAALLAHTRSRPEDGAVLERVAERGRLSVAFGGDGADGEEAVRISARGAGFDATLARLLVPAAYAALDGTWRRVKACDDDGCLEAFYDHSRNRTGRWCDMAICGNRTKVRAYRAKRDR